ncbi:UPF0481 protein At3g47200-like [Carya illinoinensis]|uniref:Uncharacterized protein n=1 Tax=Carya illinoinensis TaxID=32201 RepID=A0A8T1PDZ7_CARIL|nr:UPF0481 protein At3g47200-like [Carya illinoinensis]KAG6639924.1 hypothetical protein CIPAW_10G135900 [Carya illinoinensis]KAG6692932.1 hypothetical protein I3842_10G138700 [Carya illinoinensis]
MVKVTTKIKQGSVLKKPARAPPMPDGVEPVLDLEIGASDTSTQNCCFYSVPKTLVELYGTRCFKPRAVSIGHYNCKKFKYAENEPLLVIKKDKQQFCNILLSHARKSMENLTDIIRPEVENIEFKSKKDDLFLAMLVLDGCFILELFRILGKSKKIESNHPLASVEVWAIPRFYRDLLLLENQIPFVVLKKLFETSKMPDEDYPLSLLALRFFNKVMPRSEEELRKMSVHLNESSLHLLDLVRRSFITPDLGQPPTGRNSETLPGIHYITKLVKAGIKIKLREAADSFLAVTFKNGVIEMPKITVNYFMHSFVVNCRAFEQLDNRSSKHITTYAYFLDCLVNTAKDVEYLYECNIFDNYDMDNSVVVQFINSFGKEMVVETDQFYLYNFFENVNRRYNDKWKVQWAGFKLMYFNTPWSFISLLAAGVLLVLTFLQTYYTIYAYMNPK